MVPTFEHAYNFPTQVCRDPIWRAAFWKAHKTKRSGEPEVASRSGEAAAPTFQIISNQMKQSRVHPRQACFKRASLSRKKETASNQLGSFYAPDF